MEQRPNESRRSKSAPKKGRRNINDDSADEAVPSSAAAQYYGRLQSLAMLRRPRSVGKQRSSSDAASAAGVDITGTATPSIGTSAPPARSSDRAAGGSGFLGGILGRSRGKKKKSQSTSSRQQSAVNATNATNYNSNANSANNSNSNIAAKEESEENNDGGGCCDYCQRRCPSSQMMFHRLDYVYCSTDCTKRHEQSRIELAAAVVDYTTPSSSSGFVQSPPITPSAALLQQPQQQQQQLGRRSRSRSSTNRNNAASLDETTIVNNNNNNNTLPPPQTIVYKRSISPSEYNDELAYQLRLAAREDEAYMKERAAVAEYRQKQQQQQQQQQKQQQQQQQHKMYYAAAAATTTNNNNSPPTESTKSLSSRATTNSLIRMEDGCDDSIASSSSWGYLNVAATTTTTTAASTAVDGGNDRPLTIITDSLDTHQSDSAVSRAFMEMGGWPLSGTTTTATAATGREGGGGGGGGGIEEEDYSKPTPRVGNISSDIILITKGSNLSGTSTTTNQRGLQPQQQQQQQQRQQQQQQQQRHASPSPPPRPPPQSQSSLLSKSKINEKVKVGVDRRAIIDDVASIVSYYDDPSIIVFDSPTNTIDTFNNNDNNTKQQNDHKQQQQQQQQHQQQSKSDPPGISIDDMLKNGIIRQPPSRMVVGVGFGHTTTKQRDPSIKSRGILHNNTNDKPQQGGANINTSPQQQQQRPTNLRGILRSKSDKSRSPQRYPRHRPDPSYSPPQLLDSRYPPHRSRSIHKLQQHQQQQYQQQYSSQLQWHDYHSTKTPNELQVPPQLRPSRQELQWSANGPIATNMTHRHAHCNGDINLDNQFVQLVKDGFDVEEVTFPSFEKDDNDSKLTAELDDDEPALNDEDTLANTLDTVDLVAEVKRVWRHVQRYEKKKHVKKQMNQQYFSNNLENVNEDQIMDETRGYNQPTMNSQLLHQSNQPPHTPPGDSSALSNSPGFLLRTPSSGGASKFSDITPSSSHYHMMNNNDMILTNDNIGRGQGATKERPPTFPNDGRLGSHIRSSSAHLPHHTPVSDDDELVDSDHATSSQAPSARGSTVRDVDFLNEGVDNFFGGRVKQNINRYRPQAARGELSAETSQQYVPSSSVQARKQLFNQLQRASSPTLPGKQCTSSSPNNDNKDRKLSQEKVDNSKLLSAPYDMTKVNSGFTSITQKTQKVSNMSATTTPSYTMRTEMANKYIKQQKQRKEGSITAIHAHEQTRNQQQQQEQQPWRKPVTAKRIG